ncbi:MAG: TIGR01459 family HAD-type hydrolase [Alphaproteobacteria bacterium]
MTIPVVRGMAAIAPDYDALILDLWGVVHDGAAPFPGVIDCLARLREAHKRVIILSNAPRRAHRAAARLDEMAIGADCYSAIITSGEAGRLALERRDEPWSAALGTGFFHIGKAADSDLLDDLDYAPVADLEEAGFLLCTGTLNVAEEDAILRRAVVLGLAMVCVNPDLAVIHNGKREPCAGALAASYESLGGTVHRIGKPYAGVYDLCFEDLDTIDHGRILVVGDGLATDILGAETVGLPSLLVTGGLLADAWGTDRMTPPEPERLEAACQDAGVRPTAAIPAFVW